MPIAIARQRAALEQSYFLEDKNRFVYPKDIFPGENPYGTQGMLPALKMNIVVAVITNAVVVKLYYSIFWISTM